MANYYQYFVEGECEQKLIQEGKRPPWFLFKPGKVDVFNVVTKELSIARLLSIKKHTTIILIYDIDKGNLNILKSNITMLNKYGFKKILHVQSVKNFEEEIVYSSNLNNINELFCTVGASNFKQKFITHKNIISKLNNVGFDIDKIWSRIEKSQFVEFANKKDLQFIKKI